MNVTLHIARRELAALFVSPTGYLVIGVFAFITSAFFLLTLQPGSAAEMRNVYTIVVWLLVFLAPAISMRSVAEELSSGTIELLLTAPVSDTQIIVGKWLGALGFYAAMLATLLLHILVLTLFAEPDFGPIVTGLLGLLLIGGLYLAIGVFISTLTDSQLVAFLLTTLVTGLLAIGVFLLAGWNALPLWLRDTLFYLNITDHFSDFAKGLIDATNLIYFLSTTALFLFLGVLLLGSRRWR
ncbi:MAG: ABC transporter permease subunit [Planctomycetota bacterium]